MFAPREQSLTVYRRTNETLPIFLDSILGGGVWAVISSTALILLFGEIIPQGKLANLSARSLSDPFMQPFAPDTAWRSAPQVCLS